VSVLASGLAAALVFTLVVPLPLSAHGRELPEARAGRPVAAALPCTHTVATDDGKIDGLRDEIGPGDVVCLVAGTRPNLKIANVRGTSAAPVTIRNDGGTVVITGTELEAGLYLQASSDVRITGSGIGTQCGALFDSDEQDCGIVVDGARKGLKVATARGEAGGLEIDHIAIVRVSTGDETRGIAIHPADRQVVAGIHIHHNYVTNTLAEALYIGSEPRKKGWDELGKVDRVEVAYNLIENIGWDAIKVKVALSASRIHHNVVRNIGLANYAAHRGGVTVAMSQIVVDHNVILNAPEGIRAGRPRDGVANRYHDNVIADSVLGAIQTKDANARIYNNTIVRAASVGIRPRGEGTSVTRNIVVDAADPIDVRRTMEDRGNLVASAIDVGFVDIERGDFRLTEEAASLLSEAPDSGICRDGFKSTRQYRAGTPAGVTEAGACRTDIGAQVATELRYLFPEPYVPAAPAAPAAPAGDATVVRSWPEPGIRPAAGSSPGTRVAFTHRQEVTP
jgi:hypothetical protein